MIVASPPPSRVLLVEGQDDKHVIRHIGEKCLPDARFEILEKDGVDNLLRSIGAEVKVAGRTVVGIVPDANDDPHARWNAVRQRLGRTNVVVSMSPDSDGTIVEGRPRVGVWLWPDNGSPGEIEDFVETMIPADDKVWPMAQAYVHGIPEPDRKFSPGKALKAKIHAWLATRSSPSRMGTAVRTGDLGVDGLLATRFVDWLRRLYA